jgi:hypothetical protein
MAKDDGKPSKSDQRAAAEAAMAAFLAKGGAVKRGPDVVPTLFTCNTCGAPAVVGIAAKQKRGVRCPKCGALQ